LRLNGRDLLPGGGRKRQGSGHRQQTGQILFRAKHRKPGQRLALGLGAGSQRRQEPLNLLAGCFAVGILKGAANGPGSLLEIAGFLGSFPGLVSHRIAGVIREPFRELPQLGIVFHSPGDLVGLIGTQVAADNQLRHPDAILRREDAQLVENIAAFVGKVLQNG
jgi:hypothetical protein